MHPERRRIAVVLLTFTIGVLNVCLGYALAVFLGYGPPSFGEVWDAFVVESPTAAPAAETQGADLGESPSLPVASESSAVAEAAESPLPSPQPAPAAPTTWQLDETFVESNILKFSVAISRSGAQMREIETRLRSSEGHWDAATIESCLAELEKDAAEYLEEQGRLAEQLHDRMAELGDMTALGEQVEAANLAAVAQLETTISNLKHMDFHGDLAAAGKRLLEEIDNLRVARHNLRDDQEAAFLAVARRQNRLEQVDPQARRDYLTGLPNRIGLETALWQWWEEGIPQEREMGAILLDINGFGKVAKNMGSDVSDRILAGLAGVVGEVSGPSHLVGRYAGQRFLIVMLDTGPQGLQRLGHLLRQSIERTMFVRDGSQISVTASAGMATVAPQESVEMFLNRTEQALHCAKRGGANGAWFDNGKQAGPAESLDLRAEYREVTI
jgi:diguanylate cyclase (GGDEF)-like protein